MQKSGRSITSSRRQSMLRTAFQGVIRDALDADDVIEILANPDGSIWIERAGVGVVSENAIIDSDARDRIIRLVASAMGQPCNKETPIISGELPGSGERFEGLFVRASLARAPNNGSNCKLPFQPGTLAASQRTSIAELFEPVC